MSTTYTTTVIPDGNHASIHIPDSVLAELGTNRRAPVRVTVNGHTYQSTATAVDGECRVVFPSADRAAAGVSGGDTVTVHLELETGFRTVDLHPEFDERLIQTKLREFFDTLTYSQRKEFARSVSDAKAVETRERRISTAIEKISARASA